MFGHMRAALATIDTSGIAHRQPARRAARARPDHVGRAGDAACSSSRAAPRAHTAGGQAHRGGPRGCSPERSDCAGLSSGTWPHGRVGLLVASMVLGTESAAALGRECVAAPVVSRCLPCSARLRADADTAANGSCGSPSWSRPFWPPRRQWMGFVLPLARPSRVLPTTSSSG